MAEWGWSIVVQVNGESILFDCGSICAAVSNADKLAIDFRDMSKIVLSHGHADHTGGLRKVLQRIGRKVEIIAHPDVWESKYTKRPYEEEAAFIGLPFAREELEHLGASFKHSKEPVALSENLTTTGEISITTDFEPVEPIFYVKEDNVLRHDNMSDDLGLIVKTDKGLVIILGCAHRGIINTIRHAQRITDEQRVHTIVGGTHLSPKTDEQILETIKMLKEIGVQKIGVSHCTGFKASMRLAHDFGDNFFLNNAGTVYTLN
jgi:7,8-dihydropterin-6-yl-methyl-4-(beta-D-ribofuranosyl)aminobenzene 5'-phosphate synthase